MLALHDFGIRYGTFAPIAGLSLSIQPGDRVGLAGASGSGKTSLLRCLAGLSDAQTTGALECRARVGYMPQEPLASLSPYLPVIDQVRDCGADNAASLLDSLGLDQRRQHVAYPHQLSGGERQRVLLAQVLALSPDLLALDEPAANLDPASTALIVNAIDAYLRRSNAALLLASHEEPLFEALRCRLVRLTPAPTNDPFTLPQPEAELVLTARNLTSQPLFANLSFEIRRRETVALLGESGVGKSTLARRLTLNSDHVTTPHGVQLLPQEPSESLNPRHTVAEAFREAGVADPAPHLEAMQLPAAWTARRTSELSEGQRARVAIARTAARAGEGLLILDESLSGLDAPTRRTVVEQLHAARCGCLLITHDEPFARAAAHRVLRLVNGALSE